MPSFMPRSGIHFQINTAPLVFSCPARWAWSPSPMPDYDLWFVQSGRGTMHYRGTEIRLEPGVCYLWRPGDMPNGTQDESNRLVVFFCHFLPLDPNGNILNDFAIPYPLHVRDVPFFVASAHRIERLWRRDTTEARAAACTLLGALLWQLEDETITPFSEDTLLQNLGASILGQPGASWSLDVMAATCHLSRAQFTRRFRAAHGISPTRFVINARIERARQLLVESDLTLEQIARTLGYMDVYFFSHQFKSVTGVAPGRMRRL